MGSIPMKTHQNDSYGLKNCLMIFWTGPLYDHHFVSQVAPQRNRRNTWGSAPNPGYLLGFFRGLEYPVILGFLMRHRSIL